MKYFLTILKLSSMSHFILNRIRVFVKPGFGFVFQSYGIIFFKTKVRSQRGKF